MPSLDERVAYLEGRLEEHDSTVVFLRADIRALHEDFTGFRRELTARVDGMENRFLTRIGHLETRIDHVETRIDHVETRINQVETRINQVESELSGRIDRVEGRIDRLDDKVSRQFTWLVGLQVGGLIAVLGAVLGR